MSNSQPIPLGKRFHESANLSNVAGICPHCGVFSVFKQIFDSSIKPPVTEIDPHCIASALNAMIQVRRKVILGQCTQCGEVVFGITTFDRTETAEGWTGTLLWPLECWVDAAPPEIEDDIRESYDQSRKILSLSPMAAATMARRCLQQIIRQKMDIKECSLFHEIEEAKTSDELTRSTREALDHVRQIGNWGAHPIYDQSNTLIEVTQEEAEYTISVIEMLFEDLYSRPAQASEMNNLINRKKTGKNL